MSACSDDDESSKVKQCDMDGIPKDTKVSEFPNIWRLARKYLALPATAASSERAFSIAGLIISAKQASLDPSTVTDLHFLLENWEHVFSP